MQLQPTLHKYFKETCFVLKIPNNNVQETQRLSPLWISLTMPSHTPRTQATSPAATRTTPLRWRLAAREPAARGNARRSGPPSVPLRIVQTTPEPVRLTSPVKVPMIDQGDSQLLLCQGLIWRGAPVMGAE